MAPRKVVNAGVAQLVWPSPPIGIVQKRNVESPETILLPEDRRAGIRRVVDDLERKRKWYLALLGLIDTKLTALKAELEKSKSWFV